MQISAQGIALIKEFEGFSAQPYRCPAGKWTVGYGHLIRTGENFSQGVSQTQAEDILKQDVEYMELAIGRLVQVPLGQGQFDALTSFAYNIGIGAFSGSTLLKLLNLLNYKAAAQEFARWDHVAGKQTAGLTYRRLAETALFCATT